jgi:ketosteroid isomerase-like protein
MARIKFSAAMTLIALSCAAPAFADDTSDALAVFKEYVARSDRFDVAIADLYADDAVIKAKRLGPDGHMKTFAFTGTQWKALIPQAMPLAQQLDERNSFQDVSVKPGETGVMITAKRYSRVEDSTTPWAILVAKQPTGDWKIRAEIVESRP